MRKGELGYSLSWWAVVIAFLLLPLAGLAIEMPRYFLFRSSLQRAADATAEAAAYFGFDAPSFIYSGSPTLRPDWAQAVAWGTLGANTGWLGRRGQLTRFQLSLTPTTVYIELEARMNLIFPGVPSFPVRVRSQAQIRTATR
ncbi:MAG: pilus assembly protein TadG-related protein [Candidatus Hadarchaeales archaeon]